MLVFGDAITEAKYLRELREAVREQFAASKSRGRKTITKAVLKKYPRFATDPDLVEYIVGEEIAFE